MKQEKEIPKRKHPRLSKYDYSSAGAYFITICTHNRRCVLSRIVGRGLAPAEEYGVENTVWGKVAEQQLLLLEERYEALIIDRYVIMPNHIHIILILNNGTAGASLSKTGTPLSVGHFPYQGNTRPTIMDIVCAYKSLTTRACRKRGFAEKLFQTSFHEHIIRGQEDYDEIVRYVDENPTRWQYDKLYIKE